jgi:hypothetical protein
MTPTLYTFGYFYQVCRGIECGWAWRRDRDREVRGTEREIENF